MLVHFTRNHHKPTDASITINGVTIEPSDEAKYLGVIFDKKLRFNSQLQQAIKKGTRAMLALRSIGKATWRAPYESIKRLFLATVAARMDYGAIIWHRPQANGSTAMEIESGILPAWIRLQSKALSAITRMVSLAKDYPVQK